MTEDSVRSGTGTVCAWVKLFDGGMLHYISDVVAMQDFHRNQAWRKAHGLSLNIHKLVLRFPRTGFGSLKSQLTKAADSIAANIVEGCGAASQKDFARFLDMAIKSSCETEYHLLCARDRGVLSQNQWHILTDEVEQIRKMVYTLRKKVIDDDLS